MNQLQRTYITTISLVRVCMHKEFYYVSSYCVSSLSPPPIPFRAPLKIPTDIFCFFFLMKRDDDVTISIHSFKEKQIEHNYVILLFSSPLKDNANSVWKSHFNSVLFLLLLSFQTKPSLKFVQESLSF